MLLSRLSSEVSDADADRVADAGHVAGPGLAGRHECPDRPAGVAGVAEEVTDRAEVEDHPPDGHPVVAGSALDQDETARERVAAGDLDRPAATVDPEADPRSHVDRDARGRRGADLRLVGGLHRRA